MITNGELSSLKARLTKELTRANESQVNKAMDVLRGCMPRDGVKEIEKRCLEILNSEQNLEAQVLAIIDTCIGDFILSKSLEMIKAHYKDS